MQIREMRFMGLRIWPPQWAGSIPALNEKAVFKDVKVIIGTDLLRIDIEHNGIPYLGIIPVEKEVRASLYHKLKGNVGRTLAEIGDLEIDLKLDNEAASLRATN